MSIKQPNRWFPVHQVAPVAEQLMAEVAEAGLKTESQTARYHDRRTRSLNFQSHAFLVAVGLFIIAVLILPSLLPGDWLAKTENLNRVVTFIMVAVPVGLGVAAKKRLARASVRIEKHDSCVKQLVEQFPDLCCTDAAAINSTRVEILPLMETGCRKNNLRCGLFGSYRNRALALLEAEYTAQPGIDAAELLARAHAEMVGDVDKEQFSRVRSGEAIIFFAPLNQVPDLLICGTDEPLCGFQRQWIAKSGNQPRECELDLGSKFKGYSSCIKTAQHTLTNEFIEILNLRPKSMVQVIGGYVVIIPRTWSAATPMDMAVTAFDIQLDLDFSCALYEQLAMADDRRSTFHSAEEMHA